jgi:hypothetical protein
MMKCKSNTVNAECCNTNLAQWVRYKPEIVMMMVPIITKNERLPVAIYRAVKKVV